jgi:general secretion pathway protein G
MKHRNRGFSLVELLIVLAVIAALISTITPVAMNAIKKAKATQVAQNLRTLSNAIQTAAFLNGANPSGAIRRPGGAPITLADLGRDLPKDSNGNDLYGYAYTSSSGRYHIVVFYAGQDVDRSAVSDILGNQPLEYTSTNLDATASLVTGGAAYSSNSGYVYYYFNFTIY